MQRIIILVIIGLAVGLYAQEVIDKPKEDYRIEAVMQQGSPCDPKEIRFISPDGDIVKVLPALKFGLKEWNEDTQGGIRYLSRVLVSENCKFALWAEQTVQIGGIFKETLTNTDVPLKLTYFNAEGKVLWEKEFTVWYISFGGENYSYKMSHNGEAVLFLRSKRLSYDGFETKFYVFDTTGNEVVQTTYNSLVEGSEISPDGKLFAAEVSKDREGRRGTYFFFLDVETGRTKVVKAEGEGWRVAGFPLSDGKIEFSLFQYPKTIILPFDEVPDDLSVFFGKGDEK